MTTTDVADVSLEEDWDEQEEIYRSVSRMAVTSLVVALIAQLAWILPVFAVVGLAAVVLGWLARRTIRRYPNEVTGSIIAVIGTFLGLAAAVGGPVMTVFFNDIQVPEGYEVISFNELKPSKVDEARGLPIPADVEKWDGKKVFIKGYVHPGVSSLNNIKSFVLVPDMKTCCFGGQPKLTDMVEVTVVQGNGVSYNYRRRGIGGIFHVRPHPAKGPGGIRTGYYVLEADNVQ